MFCPTLRKGGLFTPFFVTKEDDERHLLESAISQCFADQEELTHVAHPCMPGLFGANRVVDGGGLGHLLRFFLFVCLFVDVYSIVYSSSFS